MDGMTEKFLGASGDTFGPAFFDTGFFVAAFLSFEPVAEMSRFLDFEGLFAVLFAMLILP